MYKQSKNGSSINSERETVWSREETKHSSGIRETKECEALCPQNKSVDHTYGNKVFPRRPPAEFNTYFFSTAPTDRFQKIKFSRPVRTRLAMNNNSWNMYTKSFSSESRISPPFVELEGSLYSVPADFSQHSLQPYF